MTDQPARLFNVNYIVLWQAKFVSRVGLNAMSLVVLLWIKETTGSAALMGLIAMLSGIPAIMLGIVGGVVADLYSRRGIIVWGDALKAVAMVLLAVLLLINPNDVALLTVMIAVLALGGSLLDAFETPALGASIPDLVPRKALAQANTLGQVSVQLSVFLGQGLGGVLFRVLGLPVVSLGTAAAQVWSAISVAMIRIPQPEREGGAPVHAWRSHVSRFRKEIRTGFTYVVAQAGLKRLVIASTVLSFVGGIVMILLPYLAIDHLKQTPDWVGFLSASYGVGSLIGYVASGVLRFNGRARGRAMIAVMLLASGTTAALGLMTDPVGALVVVMGSGVCTGFIAVNLMTIVQLNTPSGIRGRVFGVLSTLSGSLAPLGMGLGGVLFDATGQNIMTAYLLCGALSMAVIALVAANREMRLYLSQELVPAG